MSPLKSLLSPSWASSLLHLVVSLFYCYYYYHYYYMINYYLYYYYYYYHFLTNAIILQFLYHRWYQCIFILWRVKIGTLLLFNPRAKECHNLIYPYTCWFFLFFFSFLLVGGKIEKKICHLTLRLRRNLIGDQASFILNNIVVSAPETLRTQEYEFLTWR